MSSSRRGRGTSVGSKAALAVSVRCDNELVRVTLADGREVTTPLTPRLRAATPRQRRAGRIEDFGTAIRWDAIDEDLGVAQIIGVPEDELLELAGFGSAQPEA